MQPTKARQTLDEWRAEHRRKSEYRLVLLEEVDQYRKERNQLLPRLKVAMALAVMLSDMQASRARTRATVEKIIPGLRSIQKRVKKLFDKELQCNSRTWRKLIDYCFSNQPKSRRPLSIAKRACTILVSVLRADLPWDGNQKLKELADKASQQGLGADGIKRIKEWDLGGPGARIPTTLKEEIDSYLDVRQHLELALAQLKAATYWLDPAATGDYVTALTCHPVLVEFEKRWRVLIDLVVHGNGKVEILNIYDDFFKLGIRIASIEEVRRYFRRLFRYGDRYLLIDRWFHQDRIRSTIAAVMDEEKKHSKEPQLLPAPNHRWPNLEADKLIVHMRTGSSLVVDSVIADAIDPGLSKEVGRGTGQARAQRLVRARGGSEAKKKWERLIKRVERRWSTLRDVVQPVEE